MSTAVESCRSLLSALHSLLLPALVPLMRQQNSERLTALVGRFSDQQFLETVANSAEYAASRREALGLLLLGLRVQAAAP